MFRTVKYEKYGLFLIMGNAGFTSTAVGLGGMSGIEGKASQVKRLWVSGWVCGGLPTVVEGEGTQKDTEWL